MERRRWSADDIAKLRSMARKFPTSTIAAELGRGHSATVMKAHQLRISLSLHTKRGSQRPTADNGAAGVWMSRRCELAATDRWPACGGPKDRRGTLP